MLSVCPTNDRMPQLGDLGIAKLIKDGVAKTQIGTPHYMAPELYDPPKRALSNEASYSCRPTHLLPWVIFGYVVVVSASC